MRQALLRPPETVLERPVTLVSESHQFGRAIHMPHQTRFGDVRF